jgi:glycosyltransferase involved in cell wall biosynthesis
MNTPILHAHITIASFPRETPPGISHNPYLELFYGSLQKYGFRLFPQIAFTSKVIKLHKNDIDIVHLHWLHIFKRYENVFAQFASLFQFVTTILSAKFSGIKIVWTCHNILPHENVSLADYGFLLSTVLLSNVIICHSESAKKRISWFNFFFRKIVVMPHGTYDGYIQATYTREQARRLLNVSPDTYVYLFFGLIRPYKDVTELLDAFSGNDGKLFVVGSPLREDPYFEKEIIPRIKSNPAIKYSPACSRLDIGLYFTATDAVVYPFESITSSGSYMLPFTFGAPLVLKRNPLAEEMFNEDEAVFYDSTKDLSRALADVRKLKREKVCQSLESCAKNLAWSEVVKTVVPSLQKLVHHQQVAFLTKAYE